jgi:hypothetical protein
MSLRKTALLAACLALAGLPGGTFAAQQQSSQQPPQAQSSGSQAPQQDSLAEAARKAREKAKTEPANIKSFTNDDLSSIRGNGISTVGAAPGTQAAAQTKPTTEPKKDEAYWRKRFADARLKLSIAQKELDVMQKELNTLDLQYYSDPNKALQQQYSRDDINAKTAKIDAKKQEVAQLQQAIDDLTEELRQSGSPAGWGN